MTNFTETDNFFDNLQRRYRKVYPASVRIEEVLGNGVDPVINDHIAFRTLNHSRLNIERISAYIINLGYEEKQRYEIPSKHLNARHYEHKTGNYPRIFISELILEDFSEEFNTIFKDIVEQIDDSYLQSEALFYSGKLWDLSYDNYETVLKESQYGAWFSTMGFIANHFTISVNELEDYENLEQVNLKLKESGFLMNASDGEIKGTPELLLQQSSVLADDTEVTFIEGRRMVPGCYYEFALRYNDERGNLFNGFIAQSADRIFESTDSKR